MKLGYVLQHCTFSILCKLRNYLRQYDHYWRSIWRHQNLMNKSNTVWKCMRKWIQMLYYRRHFRQSKQQNKQLVEASRSQIWPFVVWILRFDFLRYTFWWHWPVCTSRVPYNTGERKIKRILDVCHFIFSVPGKQNA